MKAMPAAIAVIAIASSLILDQIGFSSQDRTGGSAACLDERCRS